MRLVLPLLALFAVRLAAPVAAQAPLVAYEPIAEQIIAAAMADSAAYDRLAYLCDTFGPRLSGSDNLERALDWILDEMAADGLDNVRGQPVMVPAWKRGDEYARIVSPTPYDLAMLGLGGSVGTPPEGITAPVVVVRTFEELETRADEIAGKIVLFNAPFTSYGETVRFRLGGASAAAEAGAVASLIRSVGPFSMQTPHTGTMRYREGDRQIPHAALTIEGSELLQRMYDRGQAPVVTLKMDARFEDDALSRNAVAELRGRERPDEIVVIGGHIDSWDVGQGAMDDGGGSVVAWEALRLLHDLGLRPRRTIRVVLWTNEENGLRGANAYRDSVQADGSMGDHVLAIESDGGVFAPLGFGFTGSDDAYAMLQPVGDLLAPVLRPAAEAELEFYREGGPVYRGGGGADIGPLMREGVPGMNLQTDAARYFWYHHTPADTIDKLDPAEVQRCVAAMAIMAYVAADMEPTLPREAPESGG